MCVLQKKQKVKNEGDVPVRHGPGARDLTQAAFMPAPPMTTALTMFW